MTYARLRQAQSVEERRARTTDPDLQAKLDEELKPYAQFINTGWFQQAPSIPTPQLTDFFPVELVEDHLAREKLRAREFDEKFHILQAPELFLYDLDRARAAASIRGLLVGVAYLDIDHFKSFNSETSESFVDRNVLPKFMRHVEAHIYMRGYAYRFGGDEYCVILHNVIEDEALASMERLRAGLATLTYEGTKSRRRSRLVSRSCILTCTLPATRFSRPPTTRRRSRRKKAATASRHTGAGSSRTGTSVSSASPRRDRPALGRSAKAISSRSLPTAASSVTLRDRMSEVDEVNDLFGRTEADREADRVAGRARIGGLFYSPDYLQAYVRAARVLVREAVTTNSLTELAVACVYQQRHVLELALKGLINMLHLVADLEKELSEIEKTVLKRAMPPDDERERSNSRHQLDLLLKDLRTARDREVATGSVLRELPPDLDKLVADFCALEDNQPSRLRYPMVRVKGDPALKHSFPRLITIPIQDLQDRLDTVLLELVGLPDELDGSLGHDIDAVIQGLNHAIEYSQPRHPLRTFAE